MDISNKKSKDLENKKKILMIDDSDSALEIMELYVESEFDNPIIKAANGNDAIEILKNGHEDISIIICDYNMPEGDGGDVFQYITKNAPHIPFILVCGEDPQTLKELPKLDGLLDDKKVLPVIPKPFRKDGLIQAVKYIKKHSHIQTNQVLKKIHLNRFFQYSDLFEKNKIKILGHSENYESEKVFLKYKEKNLQYIYFEKNQYELFIKLVYTEIEKEIKSSHASLDDDICLHLDGVQIIHEYLSFDHATRDLQLFTDNLASSILNIFKKNNNFEKIKNLILGHPHPSSQLAIMTSYLSCFMLKLNEPNINDELYTSFIRASLFMDGSLEDEELVTIFDLNENTFKKLSPSYKNLLHQHAKKSGELFDLVFPNDTLTKALIQNHHGPKFDNDFHEKLEKMEEKGSYLYLFSLAQNLSQEILKKAFDGPELKKAIEIIKELYPKADILDSLKKLA